MIEDFQKKKNLKKALHKYLIQPGCNHPHASNYDDEATKDDGTCEDPVLENLDFDNYSYSPWIEMDSITLFLAYSVFLVVTLN